MSEPQRPVVVGIGELLWDVYPDAAHLGGAPANFVSLAAALGAGSWLVSAGGDDDLGDRALADLRERGVRMDHVGRDADRATGRVMVTLDAEKRPTFAIESDVAWDYIAWCDGLDDLARRADAVCFGTLAQRSPVSRATIARFVMATRAAAMRVLDVNLRESFFDRETLERSLAMASVLKLNELELPVITSLFSMAGGTTVDTLRAILRRFDLQLVALTRGPDGALLVTADDASEEPAPPVRVVNTVGAGDAFTAALVYERLRGRPLREVNRRANAVAAMVCSGSVSTAARAGARDSDESTNRDAPVQSQTKLPSDAVKK